MKFDEFITWKNWVDDDELKKALTYINSLNLNLELTGSTVFGSDKPNDIDFFTEYNQGTIDYLINSEGFHMVTDERYLSVGDIVLLKDNINIIFPHNFDKYKQAHDIAKKLKLREKYPDKDDFLLIFNPMRGR